MKVSMNGLLHQSRIKCRKDVRFMLDEFLKNYATAKQAHIDGDKETVDKFFSLYVVNNPKESQA